MWFSVPRKPLLQSNGGTFARLVLPRLAPVFGDDRLTQMAVVLQDAHVEDMNETDVVAIVSIDVHTFGAPRLIGLVTCGPRLKCFDFQEVEVDLVVACHREYGPPIVFLG